MTNKECEMCGGSQVVILPVNGETDEFPCPDCLPNYWADGFPGVFTIRQGVKHWLMEPKQRRKDGPNGD